MGEGNQKQAVVEKNDIFTQVLDSTSRPLQSLAAVDL